MSLSSRERKYEVIGESLEPSPWKGWWGSSAQVGKVGLSGSSHCFSLITGKRWELKSHENPGEKVTLEVDCTGVTMRPRNRKELSHRLLRKICGTAEFN
jgi:hypothetical protein